MNQHAPHDSATDSATDSTVEVSLYETRKKVYYRAVQGLYNNWRVAFVWLTQVIYYGLPWLPWNDRQAVLFDLGARKFYLFDLVFWPQDFIWLAALLIISALGLFLFTAIAGRLWCGYACPQTVYTEVFVWIERLFEGDHKHQQKLTAQPWNGEKILRRGGKQVAWVLLSLWTGFTLVAYFTPASVLWDEIWVWGFGPWETFWIFFYAFATWGFAGMMRDQVCKYMCPYARFQSAMFDMDTLIITYDEKRGEPRSARKKGDVNAQGDCVDCGICVAVCPTGIDIRNGLQYMCIGCAACIDACDQVMDKVGSPRGLIRYSTQSAIDGVYPDSEIKRHIFRPRILFYITVFSAILIAFGYTMAMRVPLLVDVLRDRNSLSREAPSGEIENLYRLQITNMDAKAHRFEVRAKGIPNLKITRGQITDIPALGAESVVVILEAPRLSLDKPSTPIQFEIVAQDLPSLSRVAKSSFIK
ncbi:MAG: cytochrome c oxidase accessory protein CcoG [Betaproteobacteria bacterium]|nr:MAG: cytochrome c oxidase accessory protein CcoG [Betaproteobacteria bacterium]